MKLLQKNKEKWKLAKVAHSFFEKDRHWERQEMLLKVIPKKERGIDASG